MFEILVRNVLLKWGPIQEHPHGDREEWMMGYGAISTMATQEEEEEQEGRASVATSSPLITPAADDDDDLGVGNAAAAA